MKFKKRGFTLIELLVVVAIIGILATVVLASLNSSQSKARNSKRLSDLRQVSIALELYADSHNGSYPVSSGGGGGWDGFRSCWGNSSVADNPAWITSLAPTYIPNLPRDPLNHTNCDGQYIYRSNGTNYKLIAHNPENASAVIAKYPQLTDPSRSSYAYGYWTVGATNW